MDNRWQLYEYLRVHGSLPFEVLAMPLEEVFEGLSEYMYQRSEKSSDFNIENRKNY